MRMSLRQPAQTTRPSCSVTHSRQYALRHTGQRAAASRESCTKQRCWAIGEMDRAPLRRPGLLPREEREQTGYSESAIRDGVGDGHVAYGIAPVIETHGGPECGLDGR